MKVLRDVLSVNGELLAMGIPAREIRALVQAADSTFKETDYGFSEFAEILNLAGDKGIVRIEADAHHGFRYYPGPEMPHPARSASAVPMVESRAAIARPAVAEARPELQALGNGGRGKGRRRRRRRPESSAGRPIQESPAAYGESALTPAPPAAGETGGDADPSDQCPEESVILGREGDLGSFADLRFKRRSSLLFVSLVETDGCFQHQEDVVTLFLDLTDHFGNAFRFGKGFVDGVSQLPHQALQVIVHGFSLGRIHA
jgi:hypothetical protein